MNYEDQAALAEHYELAIKKHDLNACVDNFQFEVFESTPVLLQEAIKLRNSVFEYRYNITKEEIIILRVYEVGNEENYAHLGFRISYGDLYFWQLKGYANIPASNSIKQATLNYCISKNIKFNPDYEYEDLKIQQ